MFESQIKLANRLLYQIENERAVFLLREVFDYPYGEIATIVDKTEANCRQYYQRAKRAKGAAKRNLKERISLKKPKCCISQW